MFRITGPAALLAVGMILAVIIVRLMIARQDAVRGFREFFDARSIRVALQNPFSALLVIVTGVLLVLTVSNGIAELAKSDDWADYLFWCWGVTVCFMTVLLFVGAMRGAIADFFPSSRRRKKNGPAQ